MTYQRNRFSVAMSDEQRERLEDFAWSNRLSMSEMMRQALDAGLEVLKKKGVKSKHSKEQRNETEQRRVAP